MDSNLSYKDKIPKLRRYKTESTEGKLDDLGFFRTPDGSFWDYDEEYFNKYGYDVNGGSYSKELEYIPGPDWLSELGCYPDEKEKYLNPKYDEDEGEEIVENEEDIFKGDFEDDDCVMSPEEMKNIEIEDKKLLDKLMIEYNNTYSKPTKSSTKKRNKKTNKKKKKKEEEDEEGWETVEEDEDIEQITDKINKINKIIKDA